MVDQNKHIQSLEENLLDIEFRKNSTLVSQLLADDFVEFSSSGCIYGKSDVIDKLQSESLIKRGLRNFSSKVLANETVLVTYIAVQYNNNNIEEASSLRSSIWKSINNSWKLLFHQGTLIKDSIILEEYDKSWPEKALVEINLIKDKCKFDWIVNIQHIGSTAIVGLKAKPIIDIMIGVKSISEAMQLIPILESIGYIFWRENPKKDRLFFVKGMPPFAKQRTHHIHICEFNCLEWNSRQAFRDYLNIHESDRIAYESLKIKLANKFFDDRESYTDKKSEFIKDIIRKSLLEKN